MKPLSVLLLLAALSWGTEATACSCKEEAPQDLATQLRTAQREAAYIFVARAVSMTPPPGTEDGQPYSWELTTLEVKEVLKGNPDKKVQMQTGTGGDCVSTFEVGSEYLVYAGRLGPYLSSSTCSRTRPLARSDDSERVFLRTGRLPPAPVALQRMSLRCESCDIHDVAKRLTEDAEGSRAEELAAALSAGRPFFGSYYTLDGTGGRFAVGRSAKGEAFELRQTPRNDSGQACLHKVTQRHCERLENTESNVRGFPVPGLQCINPGPWKPVCDEAPSRKVTPRGVESLEMAKCEWSDPDRPTCELAKTSSPVGKGRAAWPRLVCYPDGDSRWKHQCLVRTRP